MALTAAIPYWLGRNLTTLLVGSKRPVEGKQIDGRCTERPYQNPRQLVSILFGSYVDRKAVSNLVLSICSPQSRHRQPNCG